MRRRRRRRAEEAAAEVAEHEAAEETPEDAEAARGVRAQGPWDASERSVEQDGDRIDLGSLSLRPAPDTEVRLQVDEASQQVIAVMVVGADGAIEMRAFAAPRHEDLWEDVRGGLAEETRRRGGSAEEVAGPFGPALALEVSGTDQDGRAVTQQSQVWGIAGPRWLLRATAFGRPAVQFQEDGALETALRDTVVVRGSDPMAPGEALPLTMPAGARRATPPGE